MTSIISKFFNSIGHVKDKFSQAEHQKYLIIGYPKSGNTWLRVLLGKYVQLLLNKDDALPLFDSLTSIDQRIPLIEFTHGNLEWTTQTAQDLSLANTILPYHQYSIVLLVRNIPDILVSLYWQAKTQQKPPYDGDISQFIHDPVQGVEKAIAFFQLWNEGKSKPSRLLLLRYEDIRTNTVSEFIRFLKFLQIPVNQNFVNTAIAYSNFDNMKQLEIENKKSKNLVYPSSGYPIFATGDIENNQEAFHVRKGEINGYLEYLSAEDIQYLKHSMKDNIPAWYKYPNGFWE